MAIQPRCTSGERLTGMPLRPVAPPDILAQPTKGRCLTRGGRGPCGVERRSQRMLLKKRS